MNGLHQFGAKKETDLESEFDPDFLDELDVWADRLNGEQELIHKLEELKCAPDAKSDAADLGLESDALHVETQTLIMLAAPEGPSL